MNATCRKCGHTFDAEPVERPSEHRLLCGDSASAADVQALMGDRKAALCFTSPPYFNQRPEYSTFSSYEQYNAFLSRVVDRLLEVADDVFILAWNTGDNQPDCLPMIADQTVLIHGKGLVYLDTIIWKKAGAVYSIPRSAHIRTHQYFYPALCWEPVIVFRRGDQMPKFDVADVDDVSSFHQNVWEIGQVVGSEQSKVGHPAMFPLELAKRVLMAYSKRGNTVVEPFGGSGTTILAGEHLGRQVCAMEQSPEYLAVILERLQQAGLSPRLSDA